MKFEVDKTFCISINSRQDKQALATKNLSPLSNKAEFWLVKKDSENPERGCYNSHRDIALYGLKNNLDRIMIFEDDVQFSRIPSDNEMERFNKHLISNTGELFYLGAILGRNWLTRNWGIVGCNVFCTQSYIINRKGMKKLAETPYSGIPIDVLFFQQFESYMTFPMITSQVSPEILQSDIAQSRKSVSNLNENVWAKNQRSQYLSIIKNIKKSLFV